MLDNIITSLIAIAGMLIALRLLTNLFKRRDSLGIDGKLIWVDRGRSTKPFFNNVFEVLGKPDLMYKILGGVLAVEFKSRRGPIFQSDIVQAKCAALAARGEGYKVIQLLLKTSTTERYFTLPKNDAALFKEIEQYVCLTREAKAGRSMKAWPNRGKCRGCAYKNTCKHAIR